MVDDGADPVEDMVPDDQRIRYFRMPQRTPAGAKRNFACSLAYGEIILHWEADAWYAPDRIGYQVAALLEQRVELCGLNPALCYDLSYGQARLYRQPPERAFWVHPASLCYRRSFWDENRFPELDRGDEISFLAHAASVPALALPDYRCQIALLHQHGSSLRPPGSAYSEEFPLAEVRRMLGEDWPFYEPEIAPFPPAPPAEPLPAQPPARVSGDPLVSCIMPTHNRRRFVPLAIEYFLRQDYEPKELLILDDGADPIQDLTPRDARIRYIRLDSRLPVGAKRNLACEQARGEIIVHWDDDDWQSPRRIRSMVETLLAEGADLCGLNPVLFYDLRSKRAWKYRFPPEYGEWVYGSSFCYRRAFWETRRFTETDVGEDNEFVWHGSGGRVAIVPDPTCLVCMIHDGNVSPKSPGGDNWQPHPVEEIRRALGWDWTAYDAGCIPPAPALGKRARISCITITYNPKPEWLERVIECAKAVDEHIIVDDGSEIPVPQATVRIPHGGVVAARNVAVSLASGDWIAPLDDDDYWDDGVQKMIELSQHTGADIVWAPVQQFGLAEGLWGDCCDFSTLVKYNQLSAGSWFRKSVWNQLGGYQYHDAEDWDFWLRAHKKGLRFEHLPVPFYHHLVREGSFWQSRREEWTRIQQEVERRLEQAEGPSTTMSDSLNRVDISRPLRALRAERCVATVVSPGYSSLLDDLLGSLHLYGNCGDALVAVFAVNPDSGCLSVAAKYGAEVIRCAPRKPLGVAVKSVLYSAAEVIEAGQFLCLDADMVVLGDLRPIFDAAAAAPWGSILACRESNPAAGSTLGDALADIYFGRHEDFERILGRVSTEPSYPLVVNDGLFAGSRAALLSLDRVIRGWPQAVSWLEEGVAWRNQFLFNLALAHLNCGVELDGSYNIQMLFDDAAINRAGGRFQGVSRGRPARVLHFNSWGRQKLPELRGAFSLAGGDRKNGDGYDAFLYALKNWIVRHGVPAMAWSFYGTTDGRGARINDPETFPLLASLHYLLRANGCIRVVETGTARGVSTACIASAVAHRDGGRVLTFDIEAFEGREDLWASLPSRMRACIEPRRMDAVEGMAAAFRAGERFEAALLDTVHTAEQVWEEFQWAAKLVCPGGLILVHDACYALGTVDAALQRIQAEGYGVVRLWTCESGVHEDDRLGLAVIENRRHPS